VNWRIANRTTRIVGTILYHGKVVIESKWSMDGLQEIHFFSWGASIAWPERPSRVFSVSIAFQEIYGSETHLLPRRRDEKKPLKVHCQK
jgi:hypothetical protein